MNVRLRLVLASALMLFLELALIRWLRATSSTSAYFSNFVLLGSFLGVGLGFLRWNPRPRSPFYFPIALAALVAPGPGLPGQRRPRQRRPRLLHQPEHDRPAAVARAARHLLRRRRGARRSWRARRPRASASSRARGVPLGHRRQPARHRVVHDPELPAGAVLRVGRHRGRPDHRAARPPAARLGVGRRSRRWSRRSSSSRSAPGISLVAVLQGQDHRRSGEITRIDVNGVPHQTSSRWPTRSPRTRSTSCRTSASATTRSTTC